MKKILKTVTKLDPSKFKEIKRHWAVEKQAQALYDNLWSMFDLDYYKSGEYKSLEDRFIEGLDSVKEELSVDNFVWTTKVKNEFYNHPHNKVAVRSMKKFKIAFEMFSLDSEPKEIE